MALRRAEHCLMTTALAAEVSRDFVQAALLSVTLLRPISQYQLILIDSATFFLNTGQHGFGRG